MHALDEHDKTESERLYDVCATVDRDWYKVK